MLNNKDYIMSDNRKRCRKSKLEVRDDDCEYEIVNENDETASLQETPIPPTKFKYEPPVLVSDHDYCKPGFQSYAPVNYPVFETPSINSNTIIAIKRTRVLSSDDKAVQLEIKQLDHTGKETHDKDKISITKNMNCLNERTPKSNQSRKTAMKIYKCKPDKILKASKQLAETSQNPADRILDIEMRNLWGNVVNNPDQFGAHESLLQLAIEAWQAWLNGSKVARDVPLFYQCHICNIAWWRLQPFRDHIKIHDITILKICLKENIHESIIVASNKPVTELIYINIQEDCWRCGGDVEFHKNNSQEYTCNRCRKIQSTCGALMQHETTCLYTNITNFNIPLERQCRICHVFVSSSNLVKKHLIDAHSVRSDLPVPIILKTCTTCKGKYFMYSLHNCPKSCKNSACVYCCRRFATKLLATAHMYSVHNQGTLCRICAAPLMAKCMEMEHMCVKHSSNYELVYKCRMCSNEEMLFMNEESIKLHRQVWHNKKWDKRRSYFELMLVPKSCLQENMERTFQLDTVPYVTKLKKNSDEESSNVKRCIETRENVLKADISVTVDEVDIKKEVVGYNENGDINYEEMLNKMFNGTDDIENLSEETQSADEFSHIQIKTEPIDDVKVKMEPVDDIDITDNPVDVVVKAEPVDVADEALIKVENIDTDIKTEGSQSDDSQSTCDALHDDITDLVIQKDLNDTLEVLNRSGLYKKKKAYICNKCGYTAQYKQYKVHIGSMCTISPGLTDSYPCTKCGLIFVMFRNYVLHFDTHGYNMLGCPKCGLSFNSVTKLLSHVHKHIKCSFVGIRVLGKGGVESCKMKKEVKCQECQSIVLQNDMFAHWEGHLTLIEKNNQKSMEIKQEKEEEFTVDCERVTMNNKELDANSLKLAIDHLQSTSAGEKECVICYRAFTRRYDVKRHLVEHLLMDAHMKKFKYRVFRCQICAEGFNRQEQYKFHMRDHGCMPIFKCELCNKTFSDSSNFAKHKKTHNVRVLICDMCNKKFHSKVALEKHIAEHKSLPRTQCLYCEKSFQTKQHYKRHKYKMHVKNKYKCILCDIAFNSLQLKWDHNWQVHKERKQAADCPICLKSFRKFQDVRVHAKAEHKADVAIIRQKISLSNNVQFYKVQDIKSESVTVK